MRILSYMVLLIVMFIGLTFASLNSMPVTFNYCLSSKSISLSLLLVFAFGFGIFIGLFVAMFSYIKVKRDNLALRSRLNFAEKEVENLRSIPIKGE